MLGGNEFRLRQGFGPLAQNACTARMRRPTVWGPMFDCIYTVSMFRAGAGVLSLAPAFFAQIGAPPLPHPAPARSWLTRAA